MLIITSVAFGTSTRSNTILLVDSVYRPEMLENLYCSPTNIVTGVLSTLQIYGSDALLVSRAHCRHCMSGANFPQVVQNFRHPRGKLVAYDPSRSNLSGHLWYAHIFHVLRTYTMLTVRRHWYHREPILCFQGPWRLPQYPRCHRPRDTALFPHCRTEHSYHSPYRRQATPLSLTRVPRRCARA